jgi:hypothetical protein
MTESKIFGIFAQNGEICSSHIPFISFLTQEQRDDAELYISTEAELFFRDILKINEPTEMIPYAKTISYQDFMQVNIKVLYNTLFFNLGERDFENKLIKKLKWGVTFDEELTPIQVADHPQFFSGSSDEERLSYLDRREGRPRTPYRSHNSYISYRKYGFISINGEPIFYYLHFTLQEILDALK